MSGDDRTVIRGSDVEDATFAELTDAWLAARESEQLAPKTIDNYVYAIKRLDAFFAEFGLSHEDFNEGTDIAIPLDSLDTVSTLDDKALLDYLLLWLRDDAGYADSTVKTTYFALKPYLDFLYDDGHINHDITDAIDLTKYVSYKSTEQSEYLTRKRKAINEEEHELLVENVRAPGFRNSLILKLMWSTGMRREEVSALTKDSLEYELVINDDDEEDDYRIKITGRKITVPPVKWKRSEGKPDPHDVWVSDTLRTNLEIWWNVKRKSYRGYEDNDALFLQDHGPNRGRLGGDRINEIVKDAAIDADIQDDPYPDQSGDTRSRITAHSYRHGFAFQFLENGGDIYALKDIINHASVSTTEGYLDSTDEYIWNQMDRFRPT